MENEMERPREYFINCAVVVRGSMHAVRAFKEELLNRNDIELIFMTTSGGKLFVIPEEKSGKVK